MRYPGPINLTMDCNIKKDGDYDHEKCHPNYVRCKFGRRELRACDGGEVFKSSSGFGRNAADLFGYCVEMEECQKLWNEEATMTPIPDELKKQVLSLMLDKKGTLLPKVEDCKDRNGPYAMKPCQAWYMYCYERKGYKMRCSRGFAMSPRYRKCVGKEFCDASLKYD
ncbi:hypothetical protein CAEBREN_02112 [Caenorhabditis brenneri]|uniref:Chitin-binding type-2 domain-containing protein n=1 Tax=Caenorhabditis brenneri TaxID=135651 RepID=G0NXH5_CAEBE|nr:hypothetical protein CAEBREN_02112 [Caenorhabditis brenneri]